jgi:O-antigen/teichoic acid export membrane protein
MNSLSRKICFSSLSEFITFGLSFAFNVIIARIFGSEGTGEYWVVFNGAGLLAVLLSWRFQRSITYYSAAENDHISEILGFGVLVVFTSAGAIALLLWLIPDVLSATILKNVRPGFHIIFLICCGRLLELFIIGILEGYLLFRLKAFLFLGQYLFRCLSAFLICCVLGLDLDTLISCIAYSEVVGFAVLLIIASIRIAPFKLNHENTWRYLGYSFRSYVGIVADFSAIRPDTFMVNYFWGASQAGLYAIAVSISNIVLYLPAAIKNVLMPYLAASRGRDILGRLIIICSVLFSLIGLANLLFWWHLIGIIYGEQFLDVKKLISILIPGSIFWGLYLMTSAAMEGHNRPGVVSLSGVAVSIVAILLYFLIIPAHAAVGAASVTGIVYLASFLSIRILWKHENIRLGLAELKANDNPQ